jgi:hypothetical protein
VQIDVEIQPKKRMLMAQVADFPMIFRVRRTVAEEWLAEPF